MRKKFASEQLEDVDAGGAHGDPLELEHQVDAGAGELGGEDLELEHQVDAGAGELGGEDLELEHQVDGRLFPEIFAGVLSCLAHEIVKRVSREVGVTCCDLCLSDAGVEIVIGGQYKTCLCPDCQRKIGIGPDGERLYPNAVCRVCGCTDDQACLRGCHWVEKDLCSSCAGAEGLPARGGKE